MASYRQRFDALLAELSQHAAIRVTRASIAPPAAPDVIARARAIAGGAWPDGMGELYASVGKVDIEWDAPKIDSLSGGIHIPTVTDVWDHAAHQDELYFDFCPPSDPLRRIRPIDRFCPEAYAVLYPVPSAEPSRVHYHYCGESLVETGLTYRAWLDALFVARGVSYWLGAFTGPRVTRKTWVEEGHDAFARLFPDYDPARMCAAAPQREIPLG